MMILMVHLNLKNLARYHQMVKTAIKKRIKMYSSLYNIDILRQVTTITCTSMIFNKSQITLSRLGLQLGLAGVRQISELRLDLELVP